jgi:hypothetical protein
MHPIITVAAAGLGRRERAHLFHQALHPPLVRSVRWLAAR